MTVCKIWQQVFQCALRLTRSGYQMNQSRRDPIKNTEWTTAEMFRCAEYLPDDNTFKLKLNKVGALQSPTLFCLSLQSISCLFLLLTTNLLAQSTPTGRKTVFAWQEIGVRLNNGSSCEIWQQSLTFGTPCFLPRLIYVSRLRPVPHQEEVFLKNKCVEEYRENSQHYA